MSTSGMLDVIIVFKSHVTQEVVDHFAEQIIAAGGKIGHRYDVVFKGFQADITSEQLAAYEKSLKEDVTTPVELISPNGPVHAAARTTGGLYVIGFKSTVSDERINQYAMLIDATGGKVTARFRQLRALAAELTAVQVVQFRTLQALPQGPIAFFGPDGPLDPIPPTFAASSTSSEEYIIGFKQNISQETIDQYAEAINSNGGEVTNNLQLLKILTAHLTPELVALFYSLKEDRDGPISSFGPEQEIHIPPYEDSVSTAASSILPDVWIIWFKARVPAETIAKYAFLIDSTGGHVITRFEHFPALVAELNQQLVGLFRGLKALPTGPILSFERDGLVKPEAVKEGAAFPRFRFIIWFKQTVSDEEINKYAMHIEDHFGTVVYRLTELHALVADLSIGLLEEFEKLKDDPNGPLQWLVPDRSVRIDPSGATANYILMFKSTTSDSDVDAFASEVDANGGKVLDRYDVLKGFAAWLTPALVEKFEKLSVDPNGPLAAIGPSAPVSLE